MKALRSVIIIFHVLKTIFCSNPIVYKFHDENTTHCVITNEIESSAAVIMANGNVLNTNGSIERENQICQISTNITCAEKLFKRIWKADISDNYNLLPITDRRWENLALKNVDGSWFTRKFVKVDISNIFGNGNFSFNFSVQIKDNAGILLCDGESPFVSNCYWIIIGGWEGSKSVFRKCTTEKVPRYLYKFPTNKHNCGADPDGNHTNPLYPDKWADFKLTKSNNVYTVSSIKEEEKIILTYTEHGDMVESKYVFIGSTYESPGLWKINGKEEILHTGGPYRFNKIIENNVGRYSFTSMAIETRIFLCAESIVRGICYKIIIKRGEKPNVCIFENIKHCKDVVNTYGMTFSTSWVHFTLEIKNNSYTVISDENVTLAHFHDTTLTPRYIFIGNPVPSSWKIHSYGILVSIANGEETVDLDLHGKRGDDVCVAVFAYSCTDCTVSLILQDKDNKILSRYEQKKKNIWEELKLKCTLTNDSSLKLATKVKTQNGGRAFLGDITDCSRNIRILSSNSKSDPNAKCRFLKYHDVQEKIPEQNFKLFANGNKSHVVWLHKHARYTELEITVHYKGCSSFGIPSNVKIQDNFIKLGSLLVGQLKTVPYATYTFLTKDFRNREIGVYDVPPTEHPTNEEVNRITCKQDGDKIVLEMLPNLFRRDHPDCRLIRGPLYCHIQIKCSHEWCNRTNNLKPFISEDFAKYKSQIILPYATGLTNYTITLGIGRNETNAITTTFTKTCQISTTPLAPPVMNFAVFSKTNTSISLRWEKPYPPGGVLEKFVIEYKTPGQKNYANIIIGTEVCSLWKNYFCTEIDGLIPNLKYDIEVKAKNIGVDKLTFFRGTKTVETREKVPSAPNICSLIWDKYYNLTVDCEYPFDAIGPIRQLHVAINGHSLLPYNIPDNVRHHRIQINAISYNGRNISIEAKFSNFAGISTNATRNFTLSPPKMPVLHKDVLIIRNKVLYLNKHAIENININSSLFVYGFDRTTKLNVIGTCDDLSILENITSIYKYSEHRTHGYTSEEIQLMKHFEINKNTNFVVFVKNSFAGLDRCALYSQLPITKARDDNENNLLNITWIISGVLIIIGISIGIVLYMHVRKVIVCQLCSFRTSLTSTNNESIPLVTEKVISCEEIKSHPIQVDNFQRYVFENGEQIKNQYKMINTLDVKPYTTGLLTNNIKKNRYENIVAYDETRVVLDLLYFNVSNDYINANYIKGFNGKISYIATQAPTTTTLEDFWLMIWQQEIECIVMLTRIYKNGNKECEPYYPEEEGKTSEFGGFKLYNRSVTTDDDLIITQLSISYDDSSRQITHIFYTGWSDTNVPPSVHGIIEVLHAMKPFQLTINNKPIVVHSSGGAGRTGTLILCDIASKMAAETGTIDMFSITNDLRQQRMQMVQSLEQYIFAHKVVMHITSYGYEYLP